MNMGYENEEATVRYYKHLPDERVVDIFEQLDQAGENDCEIVIEDKDLMLGYPLRDSVPGIAEYERGEDLVDEHRDRQKAKKRKAIHKETDDDDNDGLIE